MKSMSAKERNSEVQAFRRPCNSKRGHDPELQAVFQAVQKLPGNKPISNMFEIYMALGKDTDALKMKYTITAEKSHEVGKKNMDGMMTRGQMARHYNLPEDSPSIQAMIDKAVAVGAYQLHPRVPEDPNLVMYDTLLEMSKTTSDKLTGNIKGEGDVNPDDPSPAVFAVWVKKSLIHVGMAAVRAPVLPSLNHKMPHIPSRRTQATTLRTRRRRQQRPRRRRRKGKLMRQSCQEEEA